MPVHSELSQAVQFLEQGEFDVTVALATFDKGEEEPTYRSLPIGLEVGDGFRDMASASVERISADLSSRDLRLHVYTAGYKPDRREQ